MRFYTKLEPDGTFHRALKLWPWIRLSLVCREAEPGCYSNLKPQYFSEFLLRVYTKKAEFAEIVQRGYRDILERLQNKKPDDVGVRRVSVPTLPEIEAPTTPKGHSRNLSPTYRESGGESPFANNKFMDFPKNRSVSPTRVDTEMPVLEFTVATNSSPSPAKRKRPVDRHQDGGSSQKAKRKK